MFTIGHSTRPIEAFVRLLKAHGVRRVVDVRTIPRSRHNPQFNRDQLSPALHRVRIHYTHMAGLGGLRHARPDSINTGWRNASFRGYADYMQTPEFGENLRRCLNVAKTRARRADVCGGRAVALSQIADCGRSSRTVESQCAKLPAAFERNLTSSRRGHV